MNTADLIAHARWLIPVEPEGVTYENHALVVHSGRIVAILPSDEADQRYQANTTVRLTDHAIIPGLVNAHTHAAMTLFRGLADDLPLMDWLNKHIWPAEQAWVSAEFANDGTKLAVAEMLRGGITCFNDMYFFADETARVAADAGMRAMVGLILIDFPTVWATSSDEYISKGLAIHDQYRSDPLIRTAFAPHAPYTVSNSPLEKVRVLADELDIPIHMHVHETADEIRQSLVQHNERPLQRLARIGLLSPRLMAVHMTQLNDDEIAMIAATGAHIIHCPESNLKLASGFCPVANVARSGINIGLGTDGAASNNDLDMFGEMRTAALIAKAVAGDASALPAMQALKIATLGGATAMGMDNEIGSLLPGKAADFTAVRLDDIETQPLYDPVSHLVYAASRQQVTDVWVAGRQLLKNRELLTLDTAAVLAKARQWRERIAATNGFPGRASH
ncbi:MAG: N-ethylammeline chlorohydrolase [Gammaproteobacteria bacterium]|nr:MAG: N-ethylammeline chlorohydrolase [Gammaproteobacteria bacterium]TND07057.1 MAG: N-ethylammeline chlorohydrolase [Gammaproteobacteria bacterium]